MPRQIMDYKIHKIEDTVLLLGSMVETAMLNAVHALKRRDHDLARMTALEDRIINENRYAIENALLIFIATQQPIVARDLRHAAALLEITSEIERMGDYAKKIAQITMQIGNADIPIPIREFSEMADKAVSMLHRALSAFFAEDAQKAYEIAREDDIVDDLFNRSLTMIVNSMIADPKIIPQANLLLWVANNLERMADRVTNICERVVFVTTGELFDFEDEDIEENEIV